LISRDNGACKKFTAAAVPWVGPAAKCFLGAAGDTSLVRLATVAVAHCIFSWSSGMAMFLGDDRASRFQLAAAAVVAAAAFGRCGVYSDLTLPKTVKSIQL